MRKIDFDALNETLPPVWQYLNAFCLALLAVLVRSFVLPASSGAKFTTFYPAVILAFYLGGNGPGIVTIALTGLFGFYFFIPPYNSFELTSEAVIQSVLYLFAASFCGYFVTRLHRYRKVLVAEGERSATKRLEDAYESSSRAAKGARLGVWTYRPGHEVPPPGEALSEQVSFTDIFAEQFGLPLGVHSVSYGKIASIIHPSERASVDAALRKSISDKVDFIFEHRVVWPDGSEHWIFGHGVPVFSADGSFQQLDGITLDISDRKLAEEKYQASSAMIKTAFSSMEEGILIKDNHGNIVDMNYAVMPFFKFTKSDEQRTFSDIEPLFDMWKLDGEEITYRTNPYALALKGSKGTYELKFRRKDTGEIWFGSVSSAPIFGDDGRVKGVVITGHDITSRIEQQEILENTVRERTAELSTANKALLNLSHHDALTGMFNRLASDERLRSEFERMKRTGQPYSVLMADIDLFKHVNDEFGHAIGDEVLKSVTETISKNLREYDFVARWGGEEFLILLPATTFEEAFTVAEKLRSAVENSPHPIAGKITISAGVAIASPDDLNEELATIKADEGLYEAKRSGRNRVAVGRSAS